jgi:flavodoxin
MRKNGLVCYFSASGVTASVAKDIADAVGLVTYEIVPKVPYTADDLNWQKNDSRSTAEMNDTKARPEITGERANVDGADVIFLGFPIWWYTAPRIINTFLEDYDFSGKSVVLFATSGGSEIERSIKDLQNTYTRIHFDGGRKINVGTPKQELRAWASKYIN